MAETRGWLDEVGNSPYAIQLARGFGLLRFEQPLEAEFRQFNFLQNRRLRLWCLNFCIALWVIFGIADFLLIEAGEPWSLLLVRLVVLGLLLAMIRPLQDQTDAHKIDRLIICVLLVVGVGAALTIALGHSADHAYPSEGLILVSFAVYFLTGLRLGQALLVSLTLLVLHVSLELWVGYPSALLYQDLFFLLTGSLIAGMGCYLLEYKSREFFLNHRLMRELADRDSLTGLHNRRSFNDKFGALWRQAQRENVPLVLLLCDVDHFKAFNDCYGHQAGDHVLMQLGQVIAHAARRPLDIAVRMGGEEFAVLFYDMNKDQSLAHAQALRHAVLGLAIEHRQSPTAAVLSMSIGLAYVRPSTAKSMGILYERADKALYRAKDLGRNQVVKWSDMR